MEQSITVKTIIKFVHYALYNYSRLVRGSTVQRQEQLYRRFLKVDY